MSETADGDVTVTGRALLGRCRTAAAASGRPDLARRVDRALDRLAGDAGRVIMLGERGHGKLSLLDVLTGGRGTEVVAGHRVGHLVFSLSNATWQISVTIVDAPVADAHVAGNARSTTHPGVGPLSAADAVLFVSDASSELSVEDVELLRTAHHTCPRMAYLLTKIDVHPQWRRIVELDGLRLERAGLTIPVFPMSSLWRRRAAALEDPTLADESGFRPLLRWLGREVAVLGGRRALQIALDEAADVIDQLDAAAPDQLTALRDAIEALRRRTMVSPWTVA